MNRNILVEKLNFMIIGSIYLFSLSVFTSMAGINFSVILAILLWVIKLLISEKSLNYNFHGFLLPMFLFSIAIFLSGLNNWNNEILSNKFMFSFLFFFILINEVKSKKVVKRIIYFLLGSAIISSLYGLYQYYFLGYNRVHSFSFPLTYGNLIAVMVIFSTIYLLWGNINRKTKIFLALFNLAFILNLVFTKSRGAWLGFIVGIIILGFIKSRKTLVISLIVLMLFFVLMPSQYIDRFQSSFDISYDLDNNRSNTYRIAMWITAANIIKEYPVFGLGFDNYRTSLSDPYKVEAIQPRGFIHVHNTFLQFAAEIGLLGLFTFLYLMFFIIKKMIIYYRNSNNNNISLFHLATIISIIIYLVQGLTQHNFGKTEPLSLFMIMIALNVLIKNIGINLKTISDGIE